MSTQTPTGSRARNWLVEHEIEPVAAALALGGAFLTWLFFEALQLQPFRGSNQPEITAAAMAFLGVLKVLVIAAPVVALRRPWVALLLAVPVVIWVVFTSASVPMGLYVGLLATAMVAVFCNRVVGLVTLLAALVPIAVYCAALRSMAVPYGTVVDQQYASNADNLILFGMYVLVSGCLFGVAVLLRARATARDERSRLRTEGQAVAREAAVVEERARLARDLHDVVAHHVSLIAVRAETAPFQHPDLGEAGKLVLAEIAADARSALVELRGVLGVLRRGEGETVPQPGLADLPTLVEQARASGQRIELDDQSEEVSANQGYAVFRVVQEALTNARRHAVGAPVAVVVRGGDDLPIEVTVLNPRTGDPRATVEGRGLVGMRERVEAMGGDLSAVPIGADFVVKASLPRDGTAD